MQPAMLVFAITLPALGSVITHVDIRTGALLGGPPCTFVGTGGGNCESSGAQASWATAGASATPDAAFAQAYTHGPAGAEALASVAHDDFYSVFAPQVFGVFHLICTTTSPAGRVSYSFGGDLTACGVPNFQTDTTLIVPLTVRNSLAEVVTLAQANADAPDGIASCSIALTLMGFTDAAGATVSYAAVTPTPEPATWGMLLVGSLIISLAKRPRQA